MKTDVKEREKEENIADEFHSTGAKMVHSVVTLVLNSWRGRPFISRIYETQENLFL